MSKAFTKESNSDENEELLEKREQQQLASLSRGKNYITPQGHARLKAELHKLLYTTRPELTQIVSWAASNGDRSENGDYLYGKKKLRETDRRIRFLTKRLEAAEIIDPEKVNSDQIQFGATVTIENESGEQKTLSIVGIDESDPKTGYVSWISPIAKALLSRRKDDVVTFLSPKGEEELEILDVSYRVIPMSIESESGQ